VKKHDRTVSPTRIRVNLVFLLFKRWKLLSGGEGIMGFFSFQVQRSLELVLSLITIHHSCDLVKLTNYEHSSVILLVPRRAFNSLFLPTGWGWDE